MLLFLATKLRCVSKNLQSQQKALCQQEFHVSAINELIQQKYWHTFTRRRPHGDFDQHLVSISSSGFLLFL